MFAIKRSRKAWRAESKLLLSPCQVKRAGSWSARAKLKVTGQGKGPFLMMAARLSVACSGVWPPERKTTPDNSLGTCSFRTLAVFSPTSSGAD